MGALQAVAEQIDTEIRLKILSLPKHNRAVSNG
jgi:hypothetical protein